MIAGLVLSFSLLVLVGSEILSLLHLPQDSLRDAGIALLIVVGGLRRDLPAYSTALQGSAAIRRQLSQLTGVPHTSLASCDSNAVALVNCGPAPDFKGITAWLNTAGGQPLSLGGLRGKVVLVDFWTYSCINCQRTLPHVEAWYREYAQDGSWSAYSNQYCLRVA